MPRKPEPPKPTSWSIYKVAAEAIWLGTVEAPNKGLLSKQRRKYSKPTPGGYTRSRATITLRKGEISRARLRREWPHQVALSADKGRGLDNSEVVRGFADILSIQEAALRAAG